MNVIPVRHLISKDLVPALQLLEQCSLPTADVTPDLLESFVGIENEGALLAIGGVEIYDSVALIRSVATHPDHRGRGLAGKIVGRLEGAAAESGVTDIYLLTETAEAYFTKLGYAPRPRSDAPAVIASTTQFSSLCPESAVFMSKSIGNP